MPDLTDPRLCAAKCNTSFSYTFAQQSGTFHACTRLQGESRKQSAQRTGLRCGDSTPGPGCGANEESNRQATSNMTGRHTRSAVVVGWPTSLLFWILAPLSRTIFFKTGVRVACAASFFSETAETEPVKLELVSSKRRTRINSKISVEIVYVHMFTCSYEHLFVIIDGVRVYEHQLLERCSRGLRTRMVDPKRLQSRYRQNVRTRKSATQQVEGTPSHSKSSPVSSSSLPNPQNPNPKFPYRNLRLLLGGCHAWFVVAAR